MWVDLCDTVEAQRFLFLFLFFLIREFISVYFEYKNAGEYKNNNAKIRVKM